MKIRLLTVLPMVAVAALAPATTAYAATGPVDLGSLIGASGSSAAFGINDAGIIVGESDVSGGIRAVMWKNGAIKALPVPAGDVLSNAVWINNNGEAVGWGETAASVVQPLVWTGLSGSSPTVAVLLPGFAGKVTATMVNNNNAIVGSVTPTGSYQRAVRFTATGYTEILPPDPNMIRSFATFLTTLPGGNDLVLGNYSSNRPFAKGSGNTMFLPEPAGTSYSSVARATTDGSVAVGSYRISTGPNHAQLWTAVRTNGLITSWNRRDLGTLGGTTSFGRGTDPTGTMVVGGSTLASGTQHAFVWQAATGMRDLRSLSSAATCYSDASTANATGRIVGSSCTAGGQTHAVYWN